MHTLHEYMMITKAQEYLIAAAFLILFCFIWGFVIRKPR